MNDTRHLRPGQYFFWQHQIYRIMALSDGTPLQMEAETIPQADHVTISLLELFAHTSSETETVLVASSLEALTRQIEERYADFAKPGAVMAPDLPDSFVVKAQVITRIVETVKRLVSEEEQRALARREPFSQTQALKRALAICDGSHVQVQVNGVSQEQVIHVGLTSYYK